MNVVATANSDGTVDLVAKQGTTWSLIVQLMTDDVTPMDLNGYTARGQVRQTYSSDEATADFTCTILDPSSDGKVQIILDATSSAAIEAGDSYKDPDSEYVYDIEIEDGSGFVTRILQGKVFVDPEVTKS